MSKLTEKLSFAIKWLSEMCDLIAKHGLWKIFLAMLMSAFVILSVIALSNPKQVIEYVTTIQDDIVRDKHKKLLNYRMEIEPKIDRLLITAQDSLDASRIFILEPHNGTSTLNGIPFWFLNMTFERCDVDVDYVKRLYKDIEANEFPLAYQVYVNHEWKGTMDELSTIDPKLSKFMTINNAEYAVIISMMGTDTFLGFIGITYTRLEDVPCAEKIQRVLHCTAQKITIYLDGYDKRKTGQN